VGGRASGVPLHVHIHPNDVFWVNKIFEKTFGGTELEDGVK